MVLGFIGKAFCFHVRLGSLPLVHPCDDTQAEPNSDWAKQIEVEQPSGSLTTLDLFGSNDLRDKDSAADVRSNLGFRSSSAGLSPSQ